MPLIRRKERSLFLILVSVLLVSEFIGLQSTHHLTGLFFSFINITILFLLIALYILLGKDVYLSENRMTTILENASMIVYLKDIQGRFMHVNRAFEVIYRMNRIHIMGKTCHDLLPAAQADILVSHEKEVINQGKTRTYEETVDMEGNRYTFHKTIFPLRNPDNKITGTGAILIDITDRIRMEQELRELNANLGKKIKERTERLAQSEAKYRSIFENIQDVFFRTDMKGTITEISPSVSQYFSVEPETLIGRHVRELLYHSNDHKQLMRRLYREKSVQDYELPFRTPDNRIIWTSVNAQFIYDCKRKKCGMEGALRDISHRKTAEMEIRKLSQAVEQSPACVIITEKEGHIEYVNSFFEEYTGYDSEFITGQRLEVIFSTQDKDGIYDQIRKRIGGLDAWHGDVPIRKKDGKITWSNGSIAPIIDDQGKITHVIAVFLDINQRKEIEEELHQEKYLLQSLMENIPDAIYFKDCESRFLRINRSLAGFLGLNSPKEAVGRTDLDFFDIRHGQEAYDDERRIISTGDPIIGKIEEDILPSGFRRWVSSTKMPVRNSMGDIVGIVGISRDVTDVKNYERKIKLQNQKLKAAKFRAEEATRTKSEFLANMSHEIRTPMNAILGFSEILSRSVTDPVMRNHVYAINSSGKMLLQLINDILDLSKIEAGKMELNFTSVNVKHLFHEMQQIFSHKIREKNLEMRISVDDRLPDALLLDEIRIRQILLNLIGNAVKFTHKGNISVSVFQRNFDEAHSRLSLCFEVRDTGIGIAKDQQSVIFDNFKQQSGQDHALYGGTGLGLSITKRLVELMDGSIELESKENEGSAFRVILERVVVSSLHDIRDYQLHDSREIVFHGGKVLVVDDVESNRTLIQTFLESGNLEVLHAENGEDAIRKAGLYMPDVILMDIKMPVMDGYEATREIKKDPQLNNIPIVILTASAMKRDEKRIQDIGADGYLRKPVSMNELLKELSRHLKYSVGRGPDERPGSPDSDDPFNDTDDIGLLVKAVRIIEHDQMPVWQDIKDTVILSEIEAFATSIFNIGESMQIGTLTKWGKTLLQKVANYEMASIPQVIEQFPECVSKIRSRIEEEGASHG
ncbi:PAS domain S-box protein [bacterium]|nr:PAS domain S-box protein [bacterium]